LGGYNRQPQEPSCTGEAGKMKNDLWQISTETKESFLLEEYRFTVQRIKDHEERRYQLLVLNVTGFAAIFGLSSQIAGPIIPFALLSLLIICAVGYSGNQNEQHFNSAFIVEKYEKKLGFLDHDSAYVVRSQGKRSARQEKFIRGPILFAVKIFWFSLDSFVILAVISMIGSWIFSANFLLSLFQAGDYYLLSAYVAAVLLGHLLVVVDVFRRRRRTMEFYLIWWQSYLKSEQGSKG
jgi:hypothetical protein